MDIEAEIPSQWFAPLAAFPSLGQIVPKATTLGGLHAARESHLSQFWTPTPIARLMWALAEPAMERAQARLRARVSIFDNSIGCGRLVQFADPDRHFIGGLDVHAPPLEALSDRLKAAGFEFDLAHTSMTDIHPEGFNVAMINPPFSIPLVSPHLRAYACTAHGRFGPHTSTLSHRYAVAQALEAAEIVVALVPSSHVAEVQQDATAYARLAGIFHLPSAAFAEENANVETALLVFDSRERTVAPVEMAAPQSIDEVPDLDLRCGTMASRRVRPLYPCTIKPSSPTILTPVTGDTSVRIIRHGAQLRLRFACGLVEARVANAVHRSRIDRSDDNTHRYPIGVTTVGQGLLDVEVLLQQPDPILAFRRLLSIVHDAGGRPVPDAGIEPYLRRRVRALAVETIPLRHWVFVPAGGDSGEETPDQEFDATALKDHLLNPRVWGSPMIRKGQTVRVKHSGDAFEITVGSSSIALKRAEMLERFTLPKASQVQAQWVLRAPGRAAAFPERAEALRKRAIRLGLDVWCSWGYQLQDTIELSMTHGKVVAGHQMGLGKARMALSLAILGGGRANLIVLEANLVDEFVSEIRLLGLPADEWQVIDSVDATRHLRRINLISYTRLRMPLGGNSPQSYAHRLRRRVHTLIADEAHAVGNDDTLQVQALYTVSPKRRYGFTGTPCGNYPRSLLPIVQWVAGDGTAAQVYGRRRPYIEPRLITSMSYAARGLDVFREKFVTTEWVTAQWEEDMTSGGKREVPALSSIDEYREFASRFVLRRLWEEPEVARYVKVPTPAIETIEVPWDDQHLAFYLKTAEQFVEWWREVRKRAGHDARSINMVSVLARIRAVFRAASFPQSVEGPIRALSGRTSKQRALVDLLVEHAAEGRKTVVFATSPDVLAMVQRDLEQRGEQSVLYTGKIPLKKRTRRLNEGFRYGAVPTLLATFGCAQAGLNLPQATDEIFYNRVWSPRQEKQAIFRALRPQQKHKVRIRFLHLPGSLDQYQARMVAMKADAAAAGLDWATPEFTGADFVHWRTVLDEFCEATAQLRGLARGDMIRELSDAA